MEREQRKPRPVKKKKLKPPHAVNANGDETNGGGNSSGSGRSNNSSGGDGTGSSNKSSTKNGSGSPKFSKIEYVLAIIFLACSIYLGVNYQQVINGNQVGNSASSSSSPSKSPKKKGKKSKNKPSKSSSLGTKWVLRKTLEGPSPHSEFGWCLDMSDDFLVLGMPGRRGDLGSVVTYRAATLRAVGTELLASEPGSYAGGSIAVSNDGFLAVGGYKRATSWRWSPDEETWRRVAIGDGENDAASPFRRQGSLRVALGLDRHWAVAAPEESNSRGEVTVFHGQKELLRIQGKAQGDQLGKSIAMSRDGHVMAVGSPYHTPYQIEHAGQVTIYEWANIEEDESRADEEDEEDEEDDFREQPWSVRGRTLNGMEPHDNLGESVALNGDGTIVAVGAPASDRNGEDSGVVRVFQWDALESEYLPLGEPIGGEFIGEQFGLAVSLSHDGKILAASGTTREYRIRTGQPGFVRVYRYLKKSKRWKQLGKTLVGRKVEDSFGDDVVLSKNGTRVAIGAGLPGNGYVKIYDLK